MFAFRFIGFVIAVAFLNVTLNHMVRNVGKLNMPFLEVLTTKHFLLAFAIGIASMLAMVGFYRTSDNVAQGILLMGLCSIVGGTLFSVFGPGQHSTLQPIEWVLLIILALFLGLRMVLLLQKEG